MPKPRLPLDPPGFAAWMSFSLVVSAAILWAMYHFWLFREKTLVDEEEGRMTLKYRWGFAHEIERDMDQDSAIDQIVIMPPGTPDFGERVAVQKVFSDYDRDGRFEALTHFDKRNRMRTEIDADFDGEPEQILDHESSGKFLKAMHHPTISVISGK